MNSKKAKALRRAAEQMTAGQPQAAYVATRQRQRKIIGADNKAVYLNTDTQQLAPACTRATYRMMKKEA